MINKSEILTHLNALVDEKIHSIQLRYDDLNNDLSSDHKSSAGDKHETGRAMTQLEQEKLAGQLNQLEQQKEEKIKVANNVRESLRELAADVLPLALISPLLSQVQRQGEKELKTQQIQLAKDVLIARDERLLNWLKQLNLETNKLTNIQ